MLRNSARLVLRQSGTESVGVTRAEHVCAHVLLAFIVCTNTMTRVVCVCVVCVNL